MSIIGETTINRDNRPHFIWIGNFISGEVETNFWIIAESGSDK